MSYSPISKKPTGSGSCQNINHLPDDVIEHLLSFLPTKDAVATSILSKRWRYIWTRVPVLDFQDLPSCKTNLELSIYPAQFVYRVLQINKLIFLKKFRLNHEINHVSYCLTTWKRDAFLGRDFVEEVDISISSAQNKFKLFKLPSTIKGLKILKLSHAILVDIASEDDSMTVSFPSLKILHLDSVRYANDKSVPKLLLGCTALEELLVKRSSKDNVRKFIVNVPTLKTLNISHQNMKTIGRSDDELIINTPVLEYLTITDLGGVPVSVHLKSVVYKSIKFIRASAFSTLIKADFYFQGRPDLSELTKALLKTQSLCISCPYSMALVKEHSVPCFLNLTCLNLSICSSGWDVIPHILENSPNLRAFRLEKVALHKHSKNKTNKLALKSSPRFLREVSCVKFQGHEEDLEMVEFLLKNIRYLQFIRILCHNDVSLVSSFCFLQKILELMTLSEKCHLIFD